MQQQKTNTQVESDNIVDSNDDTKNFRSMSAGESRQDINAENKNAVNGDIHIDMSSVFPDRGDPRRPPEWYGRALFYAVIAVFLAIFVKYAFDQVSWVLVDIVVSLFLALAMEPIVVFLIKRGFQRRLAAGITLTGVMGMIVFLMTMFGNMFISQMIDFIENIPGMYVELANFVQSKTPWQLPEINDLSTSLVANFKAQWLADVAGKAVETTASLGNSLLSLMTVVLMTYYISAEIVKMRQVVCAWVRPNSQQRFINAWLVVQQQVSGFLYSRIILAVISSICLAVFMIALQVPYWLPLSIFCGIVSQFVPTVGTYIGGALPILSAWGSNGTNVAIGMLIYIIIYQQIENMLVSPKISQKTMSLHPATALLSVFMLGSVFGAIGAFLALPITASVQAILAVSVRKFELINSPLLRDVTVVKKTIPAQVANRVIRNTPTSHHVEVIQQSLEDIQKDYYTPVESEDDNNSDIAETMMLKKSPFRHLSDIPDTFGIPIGKLLHRNDNADKVEDLEESANADSGRDDGKQKDSADHTSQRVDEAGANESHGEQTNAVSHSVASDSSTGKQDSKSTSKSTSSNSKNADIQHNAPRQSFRRRRPYPHKDAKK